MGLNDLAIIRLRVIYSLTHAQAIERVSGSLMGTDGTHSERHVQPCKPKELDYFVDLASADTKKSGDARPDSC